ncbi:hypothetical protein C8A00DRAFT_39889 [Chaetomidium leptoderma]|uniref:Uncharacterized protein n=1 Tax=Chaetomidium leptoderma TaxID=669021 RepID=A0AAN6VWC8_9PEZI|nr:hypothetical protein C8A00DRAFT_39889 [Chaetomidium leptoderma]
MPPPLQLFEYFFDLPPELREQILSYVCVFLRGIMVGGGDNGQSICFPAGAATTRTTAATNGLVGGGRGLEKEEEEQEQEDADPPVNLFLASPILYRDAAHLYYGRNVFHLDFAGEASPWGRKKALRTWSSFTRDDEVAISLANTLNAGGVRRGKRRLEWLLGADPDAASARRRIRSAVVYVTRFGGLVRNVIAPALGDMVLKGGLKSVRVDLFEAGIVRPATGVHLVQRKKDYTGNPALRASLVVLTDPNLERVELRVPEGAHASFWCPFHHQDQGGVSEGGGRARCAALSGNGDGFIEVDIHSLVDACAGDAAEFRIKKVDEFRLKKVDDSGSRS